VPLVSPMPLCRTGSKPLASSSGAAVEPLATRFAGLGRRTRLAGSTGGGVFVQTTGMTALAQAAVPAPLTTTRSVDTHSAVQRARGSLRPALRSLVAKAPTSSLAATVAASASAASALTFWIQRNRARRLNSALLCDPLTLLPRREIFEDRLTLGLGRAERSKRPIAVGMCDVNNFKQINDSYGHAAGDDLLGEVAPAPAPRPARHGHGGALWRRRVRIDL
jgi:hypothetical protein